ncbi:MAG: ABC transporter ATP-binding protein [Deltaproteobacteria bacterium]|nr:ABC transporter ATP-binding protein [Candidatus Anaeroferrophillus wilburensis]MBN2889438.1 ABC transporter ATP-binding protein [Deltaproteobacteria bacterium]
MSAIVFQDVTKRYYRDFWHRKPVTALSDFSMTVEAGSCFAFLGLNGAGKSTALRVLMGLTAPDAGGAAITVDGSRTHPLSRVGFLSEGTRFYPHVSALALLKTAARLSGVGAADADRRALELLAFVGLEGIGGPVKNFSKGMRQRLGLAQALVNDPRLLILDEPFSGLDIAGRREMLERLQLLHDQGTTIFFSSHLLSDIQQLATHCGIIHQGRTCGTYRVAALGLPLEEFFLQTIGQ